MLSAEKPWRLSQSGGAQHWLHLQRQLRGTMTLIRKPSHGSAPRNDRLSFLRAQYIKQRLESEVLQLCSRTRASGHGSRENLIGTATDDVKDALDRRVEFKVIDCFNGAVAKSDNVSKVEMH
jgi:hypothetical protein